MSDAEICIEGFPRSGNSFFVAAFQRWNPRVIIAHHSHLASNAKFSIRAEKPTVILIRNPTDAIASAIAWDGLGKRISPTVGIISYLSFYRSLDKYREKLLFIDFQDAINDPGECVERINQKFNSRFLAHELTESENEQIKCLLISQDEREQRSELNSTLPNEKKANLKNMFASQIQSNLLFHRVRHLYEQFSSDTQPPGH